MATTDEYRRLIQRQSHDGLVRMWNLLRNGESPQGWAPGKALEFVLLRAFQLEGAGVEWPYSVYAARKEIEQVDGAVRVDQAWFLLEAKDHADAVDVEPIAKLRSQLLRRPFAAMGLVFAKNGFTDPALIVTTHTSPKSILLWAGDEFDWELRHRVVVPALTHKYRRAILYGSPEFDARTELDV
ncbi:MAG: restriction endonuclease [Capsulimonadaceae bacterium]